MTIATPLFDFDGTIAKQQKPLCWYFVLPAAAIGFTAGA
jgi:hypothetical protein